MFRLIVLAVTLVSSLNLLGGEKTKKQTDDQIRKIGRCLFIKSEYSACNRKGLSKCKKKGIESYKQFNCLKVLEGLPIEKWNEKFKKQEFTWSSTCRTVKNEYRYCLKENLKSCYKSMKERFNYLWCEQALEEQL